MPDIMQIVAFVLKYSQPNAVSLYWFHKQKRLLTLSLGGATLCYKVGRYRINRCIQVKAAL